MIESSLMKKKIFLLVVVLLTGLSVFCYNSKYMRMYIYVNFMNEKSSLENYFFEDTFIPYRGSIYISNNILNSSDNSTFTSIESIPDNPRTMYDFRNNGSWIKITPFLFKAKFSDDSEIEVQVNSEFENKTNAEKIALIYLEEIGRLPKLFRKNLETVSIHKGYENFGGGNNNFVIHHDNGLELKKYGLLEEIFLHEGVHTSLDSDHRLSNAWINAQKSDNGNFISDYAKQNPKREDLAETVPLCFALKYKRDRLSDDIIRKIEKAIPNRIEYCNSVFEKKK
ncbi:MAG: hypothetical protein CL746_00610 [Chloroflexi bacterium]|nr:hypothetical protein [Chloroflexota bacterium]